MFRYYLRIDKDSFEQYQQVKSDAAETFRYSPSAYTNVKTNCVNEIIEKARKYYKLK